MLDAHPDVAEALLNDVSVTQDGDSPFHYRVSLSYGVLEDADENPLDRPDQFNYTGAITSGPAFIEYTDGNDSPKVIVNSAGDPLEGMEMEKAEWRISITGNRADFDKSLASDYLNTINSDSYSGLSAGTVKCQGISGSRKIELVNGSKLVYWEVNVELAHRGENWRLKTWDVGFNEIVGGERKKILDAAKKKSRSLSHCMKACKSSRRRAGYVDFQNLQRKSLHRNFSNSPMTNTTPSSPGGGNDGGKPVSFNKADAMRIAAAVQKVERGDRSQGPSKLPRAAGGGGSSGFFRVEITGSLTCGGETTGAVLTWNGAATTLAMRLRFTIHFS